MAKKNLIEALESLKKTEAREAILADLEKSVQFRKDELCGLTGDSIGIDFDKHFSQHDMRRTEIRWIEFLKHLPDKLI